MSKRKLEQKIAAIEAKLQRLEQRNAAPGMPGTYITGNSGVPATRRRQLDARLDRTIDNAVEIVRLRDELALLNRRLYAIDHADELAASKAQRKQAEAAERKREAALPIVNDPAASLHMTAAEYQRVHVSFRGILVSQCGTYRYRSCVRQGALHDVYLTDKAHRVPPVGDSLAGIKERGEGVSKITGNDILRIALANPDVVVPPEALDALTPAKRNKFNAQPCEFDGLRFASKAEMRVYGDYRLLLMTGAISELKTQPVLDLPGGVKYRADFLHVENGRTVITEVKGGKATQTAAWRNKWKQAQELYPQYEFRLIEK